MGDARSTETIEIRSAVPQDADGITRVFIDSAEHHAELDPERYRVPAADAISARYREGRQHPSDAGGEVVTLVAEIGGEVVGFVDARMERSPDPMHREIVYCHIVEIAVRNGQRGRGIGERMLAAAEAWGRQHGAQFASLEYNVANVRASSFYQKKMGYRAAGTLAIKRL